jgi:hypothetical protein
MICVVGLLSIACGILVVEVVRLREKARRLYLVDGTYGHFDTPEAVVKARIEGARRIEEMWLEIEYLRDRWIESVEVYAPPMQEESK